MKAAASFDAIDVSKSPMYSDAIAETERLLSMLKEEEFFKNTEQFDAAINDEAREYFWVQWRAEPAKPWVDVDAAINSNVTIRRPEMSRSFAKSVPSEYQHRFRVEVSLDRNFNGQSNHVLLAHTSNQPTANLLGTPITIDLIPSGIKRSEDYQDLADSLKRTELWIPVINKVPGDFAFDLQGNAVDSMAASDPSAALFQTVGKKITMAIEATGDRDDKEPIAQIMHLWIDQITTSPGGKETRYRTDLLAKSMTSSDNRAQTPPQADLEKKGLLSSSHSLMLAVGHYPDSYVLDRALERMSQSFQILVKEPDYTNIDWSIIDTTNTGQFNYFSMVDLGIDQQEGLSYRSGPSIVSMSHSILPSGGDACPGKHRCEPRTINDL